MIPSHHYRAPLKLSLTIMVLGFALWGLMDVLAVSMEAGWPRSNRDAGNHGLGDRDPQAVVGSEREERPRPGRSRLSPCESRDCGAPAVEAGAMPAVWNVTTPPSRLR
jgi:hypothetical protein